MGLMSAVAGAIGGIGEQGSKYFFEEQKALIEKQKLEFAQELKNKADAEVRERIKGYTAPVQGFENQPAQNLSLIHI